MTEVRYPSSRRIEVEVDEQVEAAATMELLHEALAAHPLNLDTYELVSMHVKAPARVVFSLKRVS